MSPRLTTLGIDRMSVAERIMLVEEIWDSIAAAPEQVPVSEAQREALRRRVESHRRDPEVGSRWSDVKARLQGRP